jgi:hypothetical protein
LLRGSGEAIECECIDLAAQLYGEPHPVALAEFLDRLAREIGASCILIDGPQAWKLADNGLEHQRVCEKALHTPGKTGEPGIVKPRTWTKFVKLSIELFDALDAFGWGRLPELPEHGSQCSFLALESFPTAAWRGVGLRSLPSKKKAGLLAVQAHLRQLSRLFAISVNEDPSHDELQAIVSGLAGIALAHGRHEAIEIVGRPPEYLDGTWREGYIVGPMLPPSVSWTRSA